MPETKLKNSGLLTLAEMSVQPSIDCILRLFFSFFLQIYTEKEQASQRERQNKQFGMSIKWDKNQSEHFEMKKCLLQKVSPFAWQTM